MEGSRLQQTLIQKGQFVYRHNCPILIKQHMHPLPLSYILTIKPKEYLKQGPSHCGSYSVKGILSAYGLDNKSHPREYHTNWFGKLTGLTVWPTYYVDILRSYGLSAERKTAAVLPDNRKTKLLKSLLIENNPVMLRIGNGYMTDKYNPIAGRLIGHWITLWGYDDNQQFFYVYDSGLPEKYRSRHLSIGNTTRTYDEILRDWRYGTWQFWCWPFTGRGNYLYIKVSRK